MCCCGRVFFRWTGVGDQSADGITIWHIRAVNGAAAAHVSLCEHMHAQLGALTPQSIVCSLNRPDAKTLCTHCCAHSHRAYQVCQVSNGMTPAAWFMPNTDPPQARVPCPADAQRQSERKSPRSLTALPRTHSCVASQPLHRPRHLE